MSIAQWTIETFSVDAKDTGKGCSLRLSHDTQRETKITLVALESLSESARARQV